MSTTNKAIARRFFEEIYNEGDLCVADELVAAHYVSHNSVPGEAHGREELKAFVAYLRRAFADLHVAIQAHVAEGDMVVTRFTISGRQESEFAGIPATGRFVSIAAISIQRMRDHQIQECWLSWDALGLMKQLGQSPFAESRSWRG